MQHQGTDRGSDRTRVTLGTVIRRGLLVIALTPVASFLVGAQTAFRNAFAEPKAQACPPMPPPEEYARDASDVFEGILVDKWTELYPGYTGFLRVDYHRFLVVRGWQRTTRRDVNLTHNFVGSYRYQSFQVGHRYLVFAVLHDSPGQLFAPSCVPSAEGEDIPALAAKLGPPVVTFDAPDVVEVPFSRQLRRHARNAFAIMAQPILPALVVLDRVFVIFPG